MSLTQLFISTAIAAASVLGISGLLLLKFKSGLLWQRWLTWLGISVVFSSAYLLGQTAFNVLVCALAFIMMFELVTLLKLEIFSVTLILLVTWIDFFQIIQGRSAAEFFWIIPVAMFVLNLVEAPKERKVRAAVGGMYGSLLISLSFIQLIQAPDKSLALLLAVACFDVCSFVGGKSLGKLAGFSFHFTPKTSPNKTVGGLVAGSIGLLIVLFALGEFSGLGFASILFGAVLGDYLESWLKRFAGVKDAGNWLPGFGGLLDRFDSLVLLAPLAVFIF
jgi:phosphatidate cytidylyltransferase